MRLSQYFHFRFPTVASIRQYTPDRLWCGVKRKLALADQIHQSVQAQPAAGQLGDQDGLEAKAHEPGNQGYANVLVLFVEGKVEESPR